MSRAGSRGLVIGLTGGASAGHVIPLLAVAPVLTKADGGPQLLFYGRADSIEERLAVGAGLEFRTVSAAGLRRYRSVRNLAIPFVLLRGVVRATRLLLLDRPSVLLSKGSYVSVPVAIGAWLLRIPIVVHESDHSLGLANRIVASVATRVLLSFDDTELPDRLRRKSVVVGQVVRPDLASADPERLRRRYHIPPDLPLVLVYGGSSGAARINDAVRGGLSRLTDSAFVLHVVGAGNLDPGLTDEPRYVQVEYLDEEMADALCAADVIVSRAGANTLAEVAMLGVPAILVPLPLSVSRGDQLVNAANFADQHPTTVVVADERAASDLVDEIVRTTHRGARRRTQPSVEAVERVPVRIADETLEVLRPRC